LRCVALPDAVILKRRFIPLCVFCFGIFFSARFTDLKRSVRDLNECIHFPKKEPGSIASPLRACKGACKPFGDNFLAQIRLLPRQSLVSVGFWLSSARNRHTIGHPTLKPTPNFFPESFSRSRPRCGGSQCPKCPRLRNPQRLIPLTLEEILLQIG